MNGFVTPRFYALRSLLLEDPLYQLRISFAKIVQFSAHIVNTRDGPIRVLRPRPLKKANDLAEMKNKHCGTLTSS